MLTATVLLMLHVTPTRSAILLGDAPRRIRLVELEEPAAASPNYESWTGARLRGEYDRLEEIRPGIALPATMTMVGATGAGVASLAFGSAASNFFGVEFAVAVAFSITIIVCVGLAIVGIILLVRLMPERRAIGKQLDAIEEVYRAGLWRNSPGRPCPQGPEQPYLQPPGGPPPTVPPVPEYHSPSVMTPSGYPITLAVF